MSHKPNHHTNHNPHILDKDEAERLHAEATARIPKRVLNRTQAELDAEHEATAERVAVSRGLAFVPEHLVDFQTKNQNPHGDARAKALAAAIADGIDSSDTDP